MSAVKLTVKLLEVSNNAISLIYAACRQCYSAKFAGDMFDDPGKDLKKQEEFVSKVIASGHESPLEHVKFTFAVEGASRASTHQLVRHRIASFSQQSQRYVKATNFNYIIPPSVDDDAVLKDQFIKVMEGIQKDYDSLVEAFAKKGKPGESANQDARFILPQAVETKIVVTMNCRELMHFFQERCCTRAQWEIRALAKEMLKICKKEIPSVFSGAGEKCIKLGYCPEGKQFSCAKYLVREEALRCP